MIKQTLALVLFSMAIILGMMYAQQGVNALLAAHDWISGILSDVFSGGQSGTIAKGLIALLSIPVLIGLIPTLIYWVVRRSWFPYFMEIVWVVWLIQAGALIVAQKIAG